jgi:SAM-dependent methyltransferase
VADGRVSCVVCGAAMRRAFEYHGYEYHRCGACGLVSTLPYPSPAQIEAHYRARFDDGNYRNLLRYAATYRSVYEHFLRTLERYARRRGAHLERVLDVGCFTGDFLRLCQAAGYHTRGVELQEEAARIANEYLGAGSVFNGRIGDFRGDAPFDAVTLLGVIEHVEAPGDLLDRSAALLKAGGVLLVQTPDASTAQARVLGRYWPPFAPVEHIHLFSRRALRRALEERGFGAIEFTRHVKRLPADYFYRQMESFGPEFHRLLTPVMSVLPRAVRELRIPLYGGEMIAVAVKAPRP